MLSEEKKPINNKSSILVKTGLILLALSFCAFLLFYYPVLVKEIGYFIKKPNTTSDVVLSEPKNDQKKYIVAIDKDFSIVVPKIGINSKVIKNVDPSNSYEYQAQLSRGVAHAKGTVLPGEEGISFYFAHSSDNILNANRYNSVFYLLNKLELGDLFYLIYNNRIYKYSVSETKVVSAEDTQYLLGNNDGNKEAVLMTCWPAGTTLKRYVVIGKLVE